MFPKHLNISTTFTGTGTLLISSSSLVNHALQTLNLKKENIPLFTLKQFLYYHLSNLKLTFNDITLIKTQESDFYIDTLCEYLLLIAKDIVRTKYIKNSDLYAFLNEERIALVIAEKNSDLFYLCLSNGIYTSIFEELEYRLPNCFAFVFTPGDNDKNLIDMPIFIENEKDKNEIDESLIIKKFKDNKNIFIAEKNRILGITECLAVKKLFLQGVDLVKNINLPEKEQISIDKTLEINKSLIPLSKAREMDLVFYKKKKENQSKNKIEKTNQRNTFILKTQADSLYGDDLKVTDLNNTIKSENKVTAKQKKLMEENKKRLEEENSKKEINFLKGVFERYKNGNHETRKSIVEMNLLKSHSFNIKCKIMLLRIEFYYKEWEAEQRKEEIFEGALVPCYLACLDLIDMIIEEGDNLNELNYSLQKLLDCGFESTVLEIIEKINDKNDKEILSKQSITKKSKNVPDSKALFIDKTNFKFSKKASSKPNDKDIYFQLKYAGDKLKRTLNAKTDPRVLFTPDGWQIELLNLVDKNSSAIVSAPTSSGKTFICFYAIEKILRNNDKDVVIFCLPTKALANQVMADVYARFSNKSYKNMKVLQGILMQDFQIDAYNCQVLITVPLMLESLLKSLKKIEKENIKKEVRKDVKKDVKKNILQADEPVKKEDDFLDNVLKYNLKLSDIKYIIIDEVHKLGSDDMGVFVERVIHLSPCPLIILSATLGNLKGIYNWLKNIEEEKGREVGLVCHSERYCEIKPFVYSKSLINSNEDLCVNVKEIFIKEENNPFEKISDQKHENSCSDQNLDEISNEFMIKEENKDYTDDANTKEIIINDISINGKQNDYKKEQNTKRYKNKITAINPLFAFTYQRIKECGFSNDISFLPEELLDIYYSIYAVLKQEQKSMILEMRPKNFFKSNIITKRDVKEYEKYIIEKLTSWIKDEKIDNEQLKEMYDYIVKDTNETFEDIQKTYKLNCEIKNVENNNIYKLDSLDSLSEDITDLVKHLKEKNLLPCIIFNSDRHICNELAKKVYNDLEADEMFDFQDEEAEKRKNKWLKEQKRSRDKEVLNQKESWIEDTIFESQNINLLKNDKKNIKHCMFDSLHRKCDYELGEILKRVDKQPESTYIYRGIGVHHNGINKKLRQVVENLFRKKHIAILFSTETLSLGINMPCRTVVFAGDSLVLDVINYKQMAGRAGRRGFDTLGNVIFYKMDKKKVQNLMVSSLSELRGQYGYVNSSFIEGDEKYIESMKKNCLFSLMYHSKNAENALIVENESDEIGRRLKKLNLKDNEDVSLENIANNSNIENLNLEKKIDVQNILNENNYNLGSFFNEISNREVLINLQLKSLEKYNFKVNGKNSLLTDLILANKNYDPFVFIFAMLINESKLKGILEPLNFMNTIAHFFNVRYTLDLNNALKPLDKTICELIDKINSKYNDSIKLLYSKELNYLQDLNSSPLFKIGSFFYIDDPRKLKNNYLVEFYENGNVNEIRCKNKIDTGELFLALITLEKFINSLVGIYTNFKIDNDVLKALKNFEDVFKAKIKKIAA
ncbi:putative ATP-dependent RNA helicase ddx60 [Gurleya vavrai]